MDNPTPTPLFGTQVATIRRAKGITQEALAQQAGISVAHLSHLEQNRHRNPNMDTYCRIVSALGMEPEELIRAACASLAVV